MPAKGEVEGGGEGFGDVAGEAEVGGGLEVVVVGESVLGLLKPIFGGEVRVFGCGCLFEGCGDGESAEDSVGGADEEFGGIDDEAVTMGERGLVASGGNALVESGVFEKESGDEAGGSGEVIGIGGGMLDIAREVLESGFAGSVEVAVEVGHPILPDRAKDGERPLWGGCGGLGDEKHLVAVVGELAFFTVGMVTRVRVVEVVDALGVETGDFSLIIEPMRAEGKGIGEEGGSEDVGVGVAHDW